MQTLSPPIIENKPSKKKKVYNKKFSAFASIIEQNAIEAAFLWVLRSQVVKSRLFYSGDIKELDDRIEANLQGLSIVGKLGWQFCEEQLQYEEPGEIFTAAVVAFRSRNTTYIKMVCELALTTAEMIKGLISAMGWIDTELVNPWVQRFLAVTDPNYRLLALAVCSVRREDPGQYLLTILQDPNTKKYPPLHSRALRLIGELKRWELIPLLNAAMDADDTTVKFWANWSGALLGQQAAVINLKPLLLEQSDFSDKAIQMVFSLLPNNEARNWITEMVSQPKLNRLTIKAIGVMGDPQAIPWLLQQMARPELMRIAGWAYSQITGIELATSNLEIDQPEEIKLGQTGNAADENVAMDEDEELPWPDRQKIATSWQKHNPSLHDGRRYFQGREVEPKMLANISISLNQQQKELVALQAAIFDKATALVETRTHEQ